jgi:hypothetical protein
MDLHFIEWYLHECAWSDSGIPRSIHTGNSRLYPNLVRYVKLSKQAANHACSNKKINHSCCMSIMIFAMYKCVHLRNHATVPLRIESAMCIFFSRQFKEVKVVESSHSACSKEKQTILLIKGKNEHSCVHYISHHWYGLPSKWCYEAPHPWCVILLFDATRNRKGRER